MKIQRVVVGMDFSDSAIATMRWATCIFGPDADVLLVHAVEPDRDRFLPAATYKTSAAAALQEAASELCRKIARRMRPDRVRVIVRDGRAHDLLVDVADEVDADLIAVGPHGKESPSSRFLGTSADHLVRTARLPVLIGAEQLPTRSSRIVAAIDGSSATPAVLAWAQYASVALNARVSGVYAVNAVSMPLIPAGVGGDGAYVTPDRPASSIGDEGDRLRAQAHEAGLELARFDAQPRVGDPATVILDAATRDAAGLIILGRHPTVAGFLTFLGRTLRHVLHDARCPVLVVPSGREHQPHH